MGSKSTLVRVVRTELIMEKVEQYDLGLEFAAAMEEKGYTVEPYLDPKTRPVKPVKRKREVKKEPGEDDDGLQTAKRTNNEGTGAGSINTPTGTGSTAINTLAGAAIDAAREDDESNGEVKLIRQHQGTRAY
ncbi:hypothetical protein AC579_4225 [Pseudocercospora musae]|uniref:Uncharacterized protein n=1 Tax=Pseudocercospora musae TaxID=113226 RepID=A0A139ID05_9PEZI|nr:hypothetical protein AC579_4225 [Pseudocercospora musae]